MNTDRSTTRDLVLFFVLLVLLSGAALAVPGHPTGLYMLMPGLAAILTLLSRRGGWTRAAWRDIGVARGRRDGRAWLLTVLLPMVVVGGGYLISAALGVTVLRPEQGWLGLAVFVLSVMPAALQNSFGEELGWRGLLQSRLAHLSNVRANVLIGLLWGAWHVPHFLLGTYHAGTNLLVTLPLFMLAVLAVSFVMSELRTRTGSVWPAVVLHAVHNAVWAALAGAAAPSPTLDLLAGESGVLPVVLYAGAAVLLVSRARRVRIQAV